MLSLVHHSVNAAQFIKNINKYWGFTSQTSPSLLKKKMGEKNSVHILWDSADEPGSDLSPAAGPGASLPASEQS